VAGDGPDHDAEADHRAHQHQGAQHAVIHRPPVADGRQQQDDVERDGAEQFAVIGPGNAFFVHVGSM